MKNHSLSFRNLAVLPGRHALVLLCFAWVFCFRSDASGKSIADSTARRLVELNRSYVNMGILGPRRINSVIELLESFDNIGDTRVKADAAYVLGHYYIYVFDAENALKYFSKAATLYQDVDQWGLYLNVMKDYCNAARLAGRYDEIEPLLKKCLEVPRKHRTGFYILDPLQELTVHLSYTSKEYSEAIKYGRMFFDTLEKYNALGVKGEDFEYTRTVDAKIVELELGHSFLALKKLDTAAIYLHRAEAFFLKQREPDKLSRIYKHLAVLAGYLNQPDSVALNLEKFDFYADQYKRAQSAVLFTLPKLTRNLQILDEAYQNSQRKVERLTRQTYIILGLLVLAVILVVFAFWMRRKSERGQAQINQLLRRDFERAKELNVEKTKYFSILSHELRTPIFAITGLAKLLEGPDGNTRDNIDAIVNSGNHLLHLVNNVLQHNKLEESEAVAREEVDFELSQTIQEALQTTSYVARQSNVEVVFYNELGDLRFIIGDQQKLAQILVNLITNAIRYSASGDKIEVLARVERSDSESKTIHFSVKDYGAGIDEAQKEHLFDYRKTTYETRNGGADHLKGMGIGLFVVSNFVSAMGGQIKVESSPGKGANFYFDITFKRAKPLPIQKKPLQKAKADVSVLVVDDIKINLIVTQKTLRSIGVNCVTATDADPVIEMINQHDIDLILMDLNMPLINGYDLSRRIRQAGISIPIIAHTAVIKESIDLAALADADIHDYLIKPYPIEELKEKITQYLHVSFEDLS